MHKIVIAIDGYSGCGKSSTAKSVAKRLGYTYIDSGAMYRAATLYFLDNKVDIEAKADVSRYLDTLDITFKLNPHTQEQETYLNGNNVEQEIRTMRVSEYVSEVSKLKEVRQELVSQQQKMGKDKGVVMDGRDIGTVVFPQAELKVFMTADLEIRAARRQRELEAKGLKVAMEKIIQNLSERDTIDSSRKESPLLKAKDAVEIDTSHLEFEDQVNRIVVLARERISEKKDVTWK